MTTDIYAGNTTTTGAIAPGDTISSYVDAPGDTDWFRVSVSWGTGYSFRLEGGWDWGPPGSPDYYLDWPKLTLRSATGQWLGEATSSFTESLAYFSIDWPEWVSGIYFIEVSSQYGSDYGLYWLSLHTFAPQARQRTGTAGNDSLIGDYAPEFLRGLAGDDTLSDDITWGGEVSTNRVGDTLDGGDGNDLLLSGGAGATQGWQDWIDGGAGQDTARINFGWCDAPVDFSPVVAGSGYRVVGVEIFEVRGSSHGDTLAGLGGGDRLDGGSGNDWLDGQGGRDTLIGGDGNDTVSYAAALSTVTVVIGAAGTGIAAGAFGTDSLDGIEHAIGGAGADLLRVTGGSKGYWFDGGVGDDTLIGAEGRDSLVGAAGRDSMRGWAGDDSLLGGADDDTLLGGDGADWLEGGAGVDSLVGGGGDDHYRLDTWRDAVVEAPGGGRDHVETPFSIVLAAELESAALTGTRAINANGNAGDNGLGGNAAANRLAGFAGDDGLWGAEGADTLLGGMGEDTLEGGEGDDSLLGGDDSDSLNGGGGTDWLDGGDGDDWLDGGHGYSNKMLLGGDGADTLEGGYLRDTLVGGDGDDAYWVDRLRISPDGADQVVEAPDGGHDRVTTNDSHVLAPNVEDLELFSIYATAGTGNALANLIIGNKAANLLDGAGGDDTLVGDSETRFWGDDTLLGGLGNDSLAGTLGDDTLNGGAGNDTLDGGAGNDTLDGGPGADSMVGGSDSDVFLVNSALDRVVELAEAGVDLIVSTVSLNLGAEVENLTLAGTAALNANGNALNNRMTGNLAANRLNGGDGNDALDGAGGDDSLDGGGGNDSLVGSDGADTLVGGLGIDTLASGDGVDHFRFGAPNLGYDRITDFGSGDVIEVSRAGFGNLLALGALDASQFSTGIASGNAPQFVYVAATGALRWDADGAGGAASVTIAVLTGAPALGASDIVVIA